MSLANVSRKLLLNIVFRTGFIVLEMYPSQRKVEEICDGICSHTPISRVCSHTPIRLQKDRMKFKVKKGVQQTKKMEKTTPRTLVAFCSFTNSCDVD